jgi:hypothetical protein
MSRGVFTISLLALGLFVTVSNAQKVGSGKKGSAAASKANARALKARQDNILVAELQHAHKILKSADPIYHGHRGKALHEINHAIGALEKEMHKRGLKDHTKHNANVPMDISNALVAETIGEVGTILKQLQSMPATAHRTKAVRHLDTAVKQLGEALQSVKNQNVNRQQP